MATDIGIDLGSSKTVIFSSSKVVLELPSMVTVDAESWEPVYYGEKARMTMGRTPDSLVCVNPIEHGVIAPRLVIGVPVGFVNVEASKELLMERSDVPWIVARGRKGGSSVAAAICNALLYEATGRVL